MKEFNRISIKRILLIRTDRFGEFILNIPVIRAVRENYPLAYLCIMVNPLVKEIVEGNPDIDEVMVYDNKVAKGLSRAFRLISEIKKRNFDLAIMLNPQKKFNLITFFAGIPVRLGYNRKCGFLLTHKIEDRKSLGEKHEIEYNLDLLREIGIDTKDRSLFIPVKEDDHRFVDSLLKEYGILNTDLLIVLHPWTSDPVKQWPVKHFSQLAREILSKITCRVIIIGGKDEAAKSEEFCQDKAGLINLTGKLTLRQLAAFFKKCHLLVSNDSGPVHMAAAAGIPVIALFRNDLPAKSALRWGPWGRGHTVIEKNNLSDISVDEVFQKIRERVVR